MKLVLAGRVAGFAGDDHELVLAVGGCRAGPAGNDRNARDTRLTRLISLAVLLKMYGEMIAATHVAYDRRVGWLVTRASRPCWRSSCRKLRDLRTPK